MEYMKRTIKAVNVYQKYDDQGLSDKLMPWRVSLRDCLNPENYTVNKGRMTRETYHEAIERELSL